MSNTLSFNNSNRKVFDGTKFVTPEVSQDTLQRLIEALSEKDRGQLKIAAIHRDPYGLSPEATKAYNAAKGRLARVIFFITQVKKTKVSVQDSTSAYSITCTTERWGTNTRYIDADRDTHYMWGERMAGNKPDEKAATARLLGCAFKTTESGTVMRDIPTPKRNTKLYPKSVAIVSSPYLEIVKDCTTSVGVQQKLAPFCDSESDIKLQISSDLRQTCPDYVKGFGPKKAGNGIVCAKGTPTAIKAPQSSSTENTGKKVLTFEAKVDIANQLASSLGSSKDGIGLIRSYHYDGITDLVGAARERHEWLTDFVYKKANCYLVRTRNPTLALALYRCIQTSNTDKFIVVYEAASSEQKLGEHVRFSDDNVEVTKAGIIGIPSINWMQVFGRMDTYYVSFKPPTRAHGTGGALINNSIRERRSEHEVASSFGKYMYYGFLASMSPKDKVAISVRGRDTRVIFTDGGTNDRAQATHVVLNMVRHAIVYPYIHSCYMYRIQDSYFYPGVRDYKAQYDFSSVKKTEYSLGDLGEDVMGHEISFDSGETDDGGEPDEEEEQLEEMPGW